MCWGFKGVIMLLREWGAYLFVKSVDMNAFQVHLAIYVSKLPHVFT